MLTLWKQSLLNGLRSTNAAEEEEEEEEETASNNAQRKSWY